MRKYTEEFKLHLLKRYLDGETAPNLEREFSLRRGAIYEWAHAYQMLKTPLKPEPTTMELVQEPAPEIDVLPHDAPQQQRANDIIAVLRQLIHLLSA